MKLLLAINAGSSSVKVTLFALDSPGSRSSPAPRPLAEAQVSGLTSPPARLTYRRGDETVHKDKDLSNSSDGGGGGPNNKTAKVDSQPAAFRVLLETLVGDAQLDALGDARDISVAAHRIVHGGDFSSPQVLGADTLHRLEALSDLAPLHNGPGLAIVRACLGPDARQGQQEQQGQEAALLPAALNVACLDTSFHQTLPKHVRTYPISPDVAAANGLRKYGFHGLSYAFIARAAAGFLRKPVEQTSLIALHLGSGASACAIRNGQSWDTSMGLTPLAGLPGATRSGSVDPSLVFHYAANVGKLSPSSTSELHISRAEEILNKESGWKALTGTTDFGAITAALSSSSSPASDAGAPSQEAAQLAFDLLVDRVCGFVGAYYVSLGGAVDALVFAGGIGERSALLRRAVVERVACLGFGLDAAANQGGEGGKLATADGVADVSAKEAGEKGGKGHRVLVVQTDEQFEMARECAEEEGLWK